MEFELPQDFKELLELLNRHNVRYLLIGGYAVGLYGYPRSTNDIDIVIASDVENANRLVAALTEFGFGETSVSPELFTRKNSRVILGIEPMAVDLLNYLVGTNFEQAFEKRRLVEAEGIQISLISYDDLIANKRSVGRLHDLADVEKLEKLR
jgi:predicted nucleotidyltransferase